MSVSLSITLLLDIQVSSFVYSLVGNIDAGVTSRGCWGPDPLLKTENYKKNL